MNFHRLLSFKFVMGLCISASAGQAADISAGQKAFSQCSVCHKVADADGNVLAGKRGKAGPNLYGLDGRIAGSFPSFRYSQSMKLAGDNGLAWSEDEFVAYVQDPTGYLRTRLNDQKARSKMGYRVRKSTDAINLFHYLKSLK